MFTKTTIWHTPSCRAVPPTSRRRSRAGPGGARPWRPRRRGGRLILQLIYLHWLPRHTRTHIYYYTTPNYYLFILPPILKKWREEFICNVNSRSVTFFAYCRVLFEDAVSCLFLLWLLFVRYILIFICWKSGALK